MYLSEKGNRIDFMAGLGPGRLETEAQMERGNGEKLYFPHCLSLSHHAVTSYISQDFFPVCCTPISIYTVCFHAFAFAIGDFCSP